MNKYDVIYQATVLGIARVTAKSEKEAEEIVKEGCHNGPAVEFLSESNITDIDWEQALALPARS